MTTTITSYTTDELRQLNHIGQPWARLGVGEKLNAMGSDINELIESTAGLDDGVIAVVVLTYSGQPLTTEPLVVGAQTVELVTAAGEVANDANIAVAIGVDADTTYANLVLGFNAAYDPNESPSIFMADGVTPALANSTQNLFAVQDASANKVYFYNAASPGGAPVYGAPPSLAFTNGLSNATLNRTNLNTSPGSAAQNTRSGSAVVTVAAGDLTAGGVNLNFGFTPVQWQVELRDSLGNLKGFGDYQVTTTTVGDDHFLSVALNASVIGVLTGCAKTATTVAPVASTTPTAYAVFPQYPVRLIKSEVIAKDAVTGGTLTLNATGTTTGGVETVLASAVNVAGLSAHTPFNVVFDDAALPQDLAAGSTLAYGFIGGAGLSAPLAITAVTYFKVLVEAGDKLHISVTGT